MKSSTLKLAQCLVIGLLLSGCESSKPTVESNMTLYAPPSLRLTKGSKVQTLDGVYTPQTDEVWHSHSDYMARVYEAQSR